MSKYDVLFKKNKQQNINWIILLIIINFFLHIFYVNSVYASVDEKFNGYCDYRPQHISRYNQSPDIPINSIDNQFVIFCGILCFPINCIWHTITFPCQDYLCCDFLYRFGICAESSSFVHSAVYSDFPDEANHYYGDPIYDKLMHLKITG